MTLLSALVGWAAPNLVRILFGFSKMLIHVDYIFFIAVETLITMVYMGNVLSLKY